MRLLLLVSATTVFTSSTASSPSGHDAQPGGVGNFGAPESATKNYRGWDDDRRWSHRWDHYFGDDGNDEDDEDDGQGYGHDEDQDKWRRGHRDGNKSPWTRHGYNDDDDAFGRGYPPRGEGGGENDHGLGHHGGVDWKGHDHDHKVSTRDESPTSHDHDHDSTHGHAGRYHGKTDRYGGGDHGGQSTRDKSGTSHGHDSTHRHGDYFHGKTDRYGGDDPGDNGERGGYEQDIDHGRHNGEGDWPRHGQDGDSPDSYDRGEYRPSHEGGGEHGAGDDDTGPTAGPLKTVRVAQQLRADTEGFVSDTLEWVNEIIGEDVAATLVVDTTFSLTKNEFADLERGPCGSTALSKVFPVLSKFIDSPKAVNLLDDAVQQIAWEPSSACSAKDNTQEVEGGFYASFQVKCAEKLVLNVSIASTGSTPTIQGQAVEDKSLFINVDVWNGRIQATDAQGSISGILENRHFPENAEDIQKNWTRVLQDCGADNELSVVGVVGGGWTTYSPSGNISEGYQISAVGYTESFGFAFAKDGDAPTALIPNVVPAPSSVGDISGASPAEPQPDAGAIAASGASAYVQMGVLCQRSPGSPKACAGPAVMSQLTSFYQSGVASTASTPARESPAAPISLTVPLVAAGVLLVGAIAAAVAVTSRRRSGYSALEITHQV